MFTSCFVVVVLLLSLRFSNVAAAAVDASLLSNSRPCSSGNAIIFASRYAHSLS